MPVFIGLSPGMPDTLWPLDPWTFPDLSYDFATFSPVGPMAG